MTSGATRTFSFLGAAALNNAYASGDPAVNGVFVTALNIGGLTGAGTLVNNGAAVERGRYNSLTGGWTQSTTGADPLFVYDKDGATATTYYQTILFAGVGSAGVGATNALFNGVTNSVNIAFA